NPALDFRPRNFQRLARLLRHSPGKFFLTRGNRRCHLPQHALPLKRRQPSGGTKRLRRRDNRCLRMLAPPLKHRANRTLVIRRADLYRVPSLNKFSIKKKTLCADGSSGHLGHGVRNLRRKGTPNYRTVQGRIYTICNKRDWLKRRSPFKSETQPLRRGNMKARHGSAASGCVRARGASRK